MQSKNYIIFLIPRDSEDVNTEVKNKFNIIK